MSEQTPQLLEQTTVPEAVDINDHAAVARAADQELQGILGKLGGKLAEGAIVWPDTEGVQRDPRDVAAERAAAETSDEKWRRWHQ